MDKSEKPCRISRSTPTIWVQTQLLKLVNHLIYELFDFNVFLCFVTISQISELCNYYN